jgi:cadmium resistance protein CadD (predicted permease)
LLPISFPFPTCGAGTVFASVTAFAATNLDDILVLMLFFSQCRDHRGAVSVVGGQVLGIGLLVLVSLSGLLGRSLAPEPWIGLLGLLPISLGVSLWLEATPPSRSDPPAAALGAAQPQLLAVAAITLANGSDNIGVYLPLFARASQGEILVTLAIFTAMVGLWCGIAWRLVQLPGPSGFLQRQGTRLMPALLGGLGLYLLVDARIFSQRAPALVALLCLAAMAGSLARRPGWALPTRPLLLLPRIPSP